MTTIKDFPKTFLGHPSQWELKALLEKLFADPEPEYITEAVVSFLREKPLPLDDFPKIDRTYSRTMLLCAHNGYEAMAARWDKGVDSSIHGHPDYSFLIVLHGMLKVDNYEKENQNLKKVSTDILKPDDFISKISHNQMFDNHIHGVYAEQETLSIHISSKDATKGEIFHRTG